MRLENARLHTRFIPVRNFEKWRFPAHGYSLGLIGICLVGIALRVHRYAANRSLWIDEASLALNITSRSFLELLQPLSLNQGAPLGFLLLEKAVASTFGNSDWALRLVPLVASIVSLPLMATMAMRYASGFSSLVAVGLFALNESLIYYASEVKQYATDVLIALAIMLCARWALDKDSPRAWVTLGACGVAALWFSHPSLFMLAAILTTFGIRFVMRRAISSIKWLIAIAVMWAFSLGAVSLVSLRFLSANSSLIGYWRDSFMPLPPWEHLNWVYRMVNLVLEDPAGLRGGPRHLFWAVGCVSFLLTRRVTLFMIVLPLVFTLAASSLEKYPFAGRLMLFATPLILLAAGESLESVRKFSAQKSWLVASMVTSVLLVVLIYPYVTNAFQNLIAPPMGEDIKPVMGYLRNGRQAGDTIYVFYGASAAFSFYAPSFGINVDEPIYGAWAAEQAHVTISEIDKLRGRTRVWVVVSHACEKCPTDEKTLVLDRLGSIGKLRESFVAVGASVYLFDLQNRAVP